MNDSTPQPAEKQHQEILWSILNSQFDRYRKKLAHLSAKLKRAMDRLKEILTKEFQERRRVMRWAAAGCLVLGLVVAMAAVLECVILQEFSRELAANIKKGLATDISWLTAENINQAMTFVLITCLVAALLITKLQTNFQPDWDEFRSCPLALRYIHGWRIAWKVIGKCAYLLAVATIFYAIDARQKAASAELERTMQMQEPTSKGGIFGNVTVDQPATAAKPSETQFSGYRGLYCLDWMLHFLVLFGLQGVSAKGIVLKDVFSSESRLERRITHLRTAVVKCANGIFSLLTSPGLSEETRQRYLDLLTESERHAINEAYGRPKIVNGKIVAPDATPDEGGESGPTAVSNPEGPDKTTTTSGSVHPFEPPMVA